jgi:hypothetical protein
MLATAAGASMAVLVGVILTLNWKIRKTLK